MQPAIIVPQRFFPEKRCNLVARAHHCLLGCDRDEAINPIMLDASAIAYPGGTSGRTVLRFGVVAVPLIGIGARLFDDADVDFMYPRLYC
jgi:hypothetical protein